MSKRKPTVVIYEWDGDRSSAAGGFNIIVTVGGEDMRKDGGSYDTAEERQQELEKIRVTAKKIAEDLEVKHSEDLLK